MATRAERRAELLEKAATYRNTAVQVQEPRLTMEYLRMAAEAEQEAATLAPRTPGAPVTGRTVWKGTGTRGNR